MISMGIYHANTQGPSVAIYGHPLVWQQGHKWPPVKRDNDQKAVERICTALRDERIRQGISQQRLAEMAGISRTGLRHIEALEASPTLYSLLRIARALGFELSDLLRSE
jgi:ribosome-binding protein aMBF1 (putative translation factor)